MNRWFSAAGCGLLGAALLLATGVSGAKAEDGDELTFDQKIMQKLGVRGGVDIDYHERSPLVIPPKVDLPPPQANATVPNWPVDPDVKRRKEEANRRRDEVEESRPLRPSELNVGERTRGRTTGGTAPDYDGRPNAQSGGSSILNSLWGNKEQPATFVEEPPRTSLVEPPPGYQTPSPNQPYYAKTQGVIPGIPNFFDFGTDKK